ncbi:hypothetical protein Pelo_18617 [Pelomyxa schiedti]|nr:hypothetical protein Pelo_18617 [Pelomyxa schiedti]
MVSLAIDDSSHSADHWDCVIIAHMGLSDCSCQLLVWFLSWVYTFSIAYLIPGRCSRFLLTPQYPLPQMQVRTGVTEKRLHVHIGLVMVCCLFLLLGLSQHGVVSTHRQLACALIDGYNSCLHGSPLPFEVCLHGSEICACFPLPPTPFLVYGINLTALHELNYVPHICIGIALSSMSLCVGSFSISRMPLLPLQLWSLASYGSILRLGSAYSLVFLFEANALVLPMIQLLLSAKFISVCLEGCELVHMIGNEALSTPHYFAYGGPTMSAGLLSVLLLLR